MNSGNNLSGTSRFWKRGFQKSKFNCPEKQISNNQQRLFPNPKIQQVHYGQSSLVERFQLLQKLRFMDKNIVAQDEILDHLIDVTKLHKAHFKAVGDKVETLDTTLVTLIQTD
jgi:hypothetical protein